MNCLLVATRRAPHNRPFHFQCRYRCHPRKVFESRRMRLNFPSNYPQVRTAEQDHTSMSKFSTVRCTEYWGIRNNRHPLVLSVLEQLNISPNFLRDWSEDELKDLISRSVLSGASKRIRWPTYNVVAAFLENVPTFLELSIETADLPPVSMLHLMSEGIIFQKPRALQLFCRTRDVPRVPRHIRASYAPERNASPFHHYQCLYRIAWMGIFYTGSPTTVEEAMEIGHENFHHGWERSRHWRG